VHEAIQFLQAFARRWAARLSSRPLGLVIVYHRVGDRTGDPKREILPAVERTAFERQLRHLRRCYRVVPASEIVSAAGARRRGQRLPVAITFDDDLESHVRVVLPVLGSVGVTATFFLTGASLQGPCPFWWEDLQRAIDEGLVSPGSIPHVPDAELRAALAGEPRAIFRVAAAIEALDAEARDEVSRVLRLAVGAPPESGLRASDVRKLVAAVCTIGFHTARHPGLPSLTDTELAEALHEGRDALAGEAGGPLELIAYPHGKADGRIAAAARGAGFVLGFTTVREPLTSATDPLLVPRIVPALSPGALALRLGAAATAR
jgi:peptidoglycan/xylan/chitin deacetylase (PgdA/CDA1 family)